MEANIRELNAQIDKECPICHTDMVLPVAVPGCGHTFCFICLKGVSIQNMGGCPICRGPIDENVFKQPKQGMDLKMAIPESPGPSEPKKRRVDEGSETKNGDVKVEPKDDEEKAEEEDVKPDVSALNAQIANPAAQNTTNQTEQAVAATERKYWLYHGRKRGWWRFDPRTEKDIEEASSNGMPITEVIICGSRYIVDFTQMVQYPKDAGLVHKRDIKCVSSNEFDAMNIKGVAGVFAR